jgi:glucose dehydrogenase
MFIGSVIYDQIDQQTHSALFTAFREFDKVAQCAISGIDAVVIGAAFPPEFPWVVKITATLLPASVIHCHGAERPHASWRAYGGAEDGAQYSSLKQVDRGNVMQLKPMWIASTGDEAIYAFNPLVIGDTLYALAEKDHILALDAATGKQKWSHSIHAKTQLVLVGIETILNECVCRFSLQA